MKESSTVPIIDANQLISNLHKELKTYVAFTTKVHSNFHINRIEEYMKIVNFPTQSDVVPRRISVFSFFFLTKGRSIRSKGLDSYDFGENTFFFLPAYQITTHQEICFGSEGYYCHFDMELLNVDYKTKDLINDFTFLEFNANPIVMINDEAKERIIPLLERLITEYKAGDDCRFDILRIYLIAVFTELKAFINYSKPNLSNSAYLITEQYKKYLAQYIYEKQKTTDYAEMMAISPNHLNKCVKSTLGKSAHDLLKEMLLLEAKFLLKQSDLNISEIAYKIGRNEISDFGRFFKAQTGMTPSEYRLTKLM
ncbi:helix-turn-helix domain-containing protein [Arcicella sp. DC2W]|uniref:Helix-turn-helix domain-containing protein n=1 Tax=Arcicella gelida TaxID=2984195 RepID=A0ABU5S3C7_9BACT|nr:helix-turn-helix domain-containing protein [Arcicella sp. DC2W]MEA5402951.1 helix-turn-helix domain-containing protein [Arcicella sp. DC2W]